jgi:aspartyl-tRNA synthetase
MCASLGWVHRVRDHGGVLFIDLRDHYGLTQVRGRSRLDRVSSDAEKLRAEWVVRIDGEVKRHVPGTANAEPPTGGIEVFIREIEVLGHGDATCRCPCSASQDYPEDIRLRYRFLDLRRETLHANIVKRTKIIASMRST